jgi:DNA (cytosine-5)-methyltransferase 1
MKIGSLFAGIGGFDLAARWVGWDTAWFSEIDPYASAVLQKHWPGVPNHGDITKIKGSDVAPVDVLCGGFPCQDISLAGKGAGITGARSGLWSEYARLIGELRPRYVVAENVPALRSRGLDQVLGSLAALGYDAEWHCIPAAAVGAPHRRDRIWIVAYPNAVSERVPNDRRGEVASAARSLQREAPERQRIRFDVGQLRDALADALGPRLSERRGTVSIQAEESAVERRGQDVADAPRDVRAEQTASGTVGERTGSRSEPDGRDPRWWLTEPDVGRVAHGVPSPVDRLRCLGNAIVPQVASLIFQAIAAAEESVARAA